MNSNSFETDDQLAIAENYYDAMLEKNFDRMASFLHNNVHFISPFGEIDGKDAVARAAAKDLCTILQDIKIRSRFTNNNQIMLAYDFIFSGSTGKLRAAVLMEFEGHLISKLELFFDGRQFK